MDNLFFFFDVQRYMYFAMLEWDYRNKLNEEERNFHFVHVILPHQNCWVAVNNHWSCFSLLRSFEPDEKLWNPSSENSKFCWEIECWQLTSKVFNLIGYFFPISIYVCKLRKSEHDFLEVQCWIEIDSNFFFYYDTSCVFNLGESR